MRVSAQALQGLLSNVGRAVPALERLVDFIAFAEG
jgi:hypothetical protein